MPKQLAVVSIKNKFKIELSSITQVKANKLTLNFHTEKKLKMFNYFQILKPILVFLVFFSFLVNEFQQSCNIRLLKRM